LRRRDREAVERSARRHGLEERIATLEQTIVQRQTQVTRLEREVGELVAAVTELLPRLELPAAVEVTRVQARLDELQALATRARELQETAATLAAEQTEIDRFEAAVAEVLQQLGCDPEQRSPEHVMEWLHEDLERFRQQATARREALHQAARKQEQSQQAAARLAAVRAGLPPPWAGPAATDAGLAELAVRALRRHEVQERLAGLEERLARRLGDGEDRARSEASLEHAEEAELRARLEQLRTEVQELEQRRDRCSRELGSREQELRGLGGDEAARARAELEEHRSSLQEQTERFLVLTVARQVLEQVLATFVREHQPELLERTSALVRSITAGRYARVLRPPGEDTLALVTSDGEERHPADLSTGTREQLFLALRLAFVLQHCERHEPLPVIMDDVTANFDPGRARATLQALGQVAETTQVLLLTCHDHLAALAAEAVPGATVVPVVT
jgi:uncharacterized protein YhaN